MADKYVVRLSDGREISITNKILQSYDTINNLVGDIVVESGEPIVLNYDDAEGLYLALTTDVYTAQYNLEQFVRVSKAIDFLNNEIILKRVLARLSLMFEQQEFLSTSKDGMQDLLLILPQTTEYRFFKVVNVPVTDYMTEIVRYSGLAVGEDLSQLLVVDYIFDENHIAQIAQVQPQQFNPLQPTPAQQQQLTQLVNQINQGPINQVQQNQLNNILYQLAIQANPPQPNLPANPPQPNIPANPPQPNIPANPPQPNLPANPPQANQPANPPQPNLPANPPQANQPQPNLPANPQNPPPNQPNQWQEPDRNVRYTIYHNGQDSRNFTINYPGYGVDQTDRHDNPGIWFIDNDSNVYATTLYLSDDHETIEDLIVFIEMGDGLILEYNVADNYVEHVSSIRPDEPTVIQAISRNGQRYTIIYRLTLNEFIYEVRERIAGQHFSINDRCLSTISIPFGAHVRRAPIPSGSPRMKIVIYQLSNDVALGTYRVLCPDNNITTVITLPKLENICVYMADPARISLPCYGYILYPFDETRFAIVTKSKKEGKRRVTIYDLIGQILGCYKFDNEIPIAVDNNYIVTIDGVINERNLKKYITNPDINANTHLRVWFIISPVEAILVSKTKIVLNVPPNAVWSIRSVWTGSNDSLLIEYIYKVFTESEENPKLIKILRKYTIKRYDGIKSFVEDKL